MLAAPRALLAGTTRRSAPEDAAKLAWELVTVEDPRKFVASFDPAALTQFRSQFAHLIELARLKNQTREVLQFFGVRAVSQLEEWSDAQLFEAVWHNMRAREPETAEAARHFDFQALGHVRQGRRAYVLYHLTSRHPDYAPPIWPNVVSLESTRAGWAMLLNGSLEGLKRVSDNLDDLLDRLHFQVTDVVGHVPVDDSGFLIIKSVTTAGPLRLTQIGRVLFSPHDDAWPHFQAGDTRALLRALNNRYGGSAG